MKKGVKIITVCAAVLTIAAVAALSVIYFFDIRHIIENIKDKKRSRKCF